MKKLILAFALFAGATTFTATTSQAQISVSFNIGRQPLWGPTGYDYAGYYYMPDIDAYYSVADQQFIYMERGQWVFRSELPYRYRNYDLYNTYKVVVNENRPWMRNDYYRRQYYSYRGRRGQAFIRDSRDNRYWENPNHPYHNQWHDRGVMRNDDRGNRDNRGRDDRRNDRRDDRQYNDRGRNDRGGDRGGDRNDRGGDRNGRGDDRNGRGGNGNGGVNGGAGTHGNTGGNNNSGNTGGNTGGGVQGNGRGIPHATIGGDNAGRIAPSTRNNNAVSPGNGGSNNGGGNGNNGGGNGNNGGGNGGHGGHGNGNGDHTGGH